MKRKWFLFFSLVVMLIFLSQSAFARTVRGKTEYTDRQTFKKEVRHEGRVYTDPIIINDYGQLRAWSMNYIPGQKDLIGTSGMSQYSCVSCYYPMQPGRLHIIDPVAILESINSAKDYDPGGTTGFAGDGAKGTGGYSGVTLIMFDTDKYPYHTASVMMAVTGPTGYAHMKTGATPIWVWPWPGGVKNLSEVTNYSSGAYHAQSMLIRSGDSPYFMNDAANANNPGGIPYAWSVLGGVSGASNAQVQRPGDIVEFMGFPDSSVSIVPVPKFLTNGWNGRTL
jgi:hypothetical protein